MSDVGKRVLMAVRSDSPFRNLTVDERRALLEMGEGHSAEAMVGILRNLSQPIHCSVPAWRRFARRVRAEQMAREMCDVKESTEALAKADSAGLREAALSATRQQLYAISLGAEDAATALQINGALTAEKTRERELELEERKVRVAEENARLGWKRLEMERAVAAAKLLPKVWAILTDRRIGANEKVTRARDCLSLGGGNGALAVGWVGEGGGVEHGKKTEGAEEVAHDGTGGGEGE